jgi:hypothetical protein
MYKITLQFISLTIDHTGSTNKTNYFIMQDYAQPTSTSKTNMPPKSLRRKHHHRRRRTRERQQVCHELTMITTGPECDGSPTRRYRSRPHHRSHHRQTKNTNTVITLPYFANQKMIKVQDAIDHACKKNCGRGIAIDDNNIDSIKMIFPCIEWDDDDENDDEEETGGGGGSLSSNHPGWLSSTSSSSWTISHHDDDIDEVMVDDEGGLYNQKWIAANNEDDEEGGEDDVCCDLDNVSNGLLNLSLKVPSKNDNHDHHRNSPRHHPQYHLLHRTLAFDSNLSSLAHQHHR